MISSGQATPQTGLGAEINEQNVRSIWASLLLFPTLLHSPFGAALMLSGPLNMLNVQFYKCIMRLV